MKVVMKKRLRSDEQPPDIPAYIINDRDWNYFESFAMRGGWREGLRRVGAAWQAHAVGLILVNLVWAISLFTLVGTPPVTAMLYLAVRRALNREPITYDMVVYSVRRYAWQSWAWSIPFYVLGLGMFAVLGAVQSQTLPLWAGWLAQGIFAAWVGLNLYFWVLWWHTIPEQRGVIEMWRKTLDYWRLYPQMAIVGVVVGAVLSTLLVFSGWLFVFLLLLVIPVTIVLIGTAIVGAYPPRA
jgi:hypothetical protein